MSDLSRRTFFTGLTGALICAPAIVRVSSLMRMPRAPLFVKGELQRNLDLYWEWKRKMIERIINPPLLADANGRLQFLIDPQGQMHVGTSVSPLNYAQIMGAQI